MKYSLGDFFTSIVYIFVIFLPGGFLLLGLFYSLPDDLKNKILSFEGGETGRILLFLSVSFVLGHLVSLIGSSWEDRWWKAIKGKKTRGEVSDKILSIVRSILHDSVPPSLVIDDNMRRWAYTILKNSEPPSFRDIEAKDADRRFFRNLRVVLISILILLLVSVYTRPYEHYSLLVVANLVLLWLSHLRYADQDKKYTKAVYESLIVSRPPKEHQVDSGKNKEIERRFLVNGDSWRGRGSGVEIRQGYLSTDEERIVRIRLEGADAYITIKGKSVGATQPEYEYQIPHKDANLILSTMCKDFIIEKTRYTLNVAGYDWEIDEFKGLNNGLVIAEIEAKDEMEFENVIKNKPAWLGDEITSRYEYRNSNLSQCPYSHWNKQGHS